MGAENSSLKHDLTAQQKYLKCVPRQPYQPFPEEMHMSGEGQGGLLLEARALPSPLARGDLSDDTYWWMDAQFLPYNDAQLVVTSSAFIPRIANAWVSLARVPQGRVRLYDLSSSPMKVHQFPGTDSSVFPKVQPHPLGEAVGYVGTCEVRVDSLQLDVLYSKARDIDNRSQRFCAFSPNGANLAILSRFSGVFYLEIFYLDLKLINFQPPVACHKLCPGFLGTRSYNDHVECKWSPDGSHLAISSSQGKLFLLDKSTCKTVIPLSEQLSTAGSFDFDPRACCSVIAVASSEGVLTIIQINVAQRQSSAVRQLDTDGIVDCLQYNQDGSHLALSFRSFEVRVYSTEDLSTLHVIDIAPLCPQHVAAYQNQAFPTVHRLSFSFDGRHLVTSSCDGILRVWAVPRLLSLQQWCRKAILQNVPIVVVRQWDLPQKLRRFLLSEPID